MALAGRDRRRFSVNKAASSRPWLSCHSVDSCPSKVSASGGRNSVPSAVEPMHCDASPDPARLRPLVDSRAILALFFRGEGVIIGLFYILIGYRCGRHNFL